MSWASSRAADLAHADPPPRPSRADGPRAAAAGGVPALAHRRGGHHADLHLAVDLDREERPEEGHAADEVVGAVDRVDVPADARRALLVAVLLADEAVVRVDGPDPLAEEALDRPVGLGDERAVGLARRSGTSRRIPAQGDAVGLVAHLERQRRARPRGRPRARGAARRSRRRRTAAASATLTRPRPRVRQGRGGRAVPLRAVRARSGPGGRPSRSPAAGRRGRRAWPPGWPGSRPSSAGSRAGA